MLIIITNPTTPDQINKLRKFIDLKGYKNVVFERVSTLSKTKKMVSSSTDPIVILNNRKRSFSKKDIENICSKYDENICSNVQFWKYSEDETSLNALEFIISEYYDSIKPKYVNKEPNEDAFAYLFAIDAIKTAVEIEMRTESSSYDTNEIWYRIKNNIISCLSDRMKDFTGGINVKSMCGAIAIAKQFIDKTNEEFSK